MHVRRYDRNFKFAALGLNSQMAPQPTLSPCRPIAHARWDLAGRGSEMPCAAIEIWETKSARSSPTAQSCDELRPGLVVSRGMLHPAAGSPHAVQARLA